MIYNHVVCKNNIVPLFTIATDDEATDPPQPDGMTSDIAAEAPGGGQVRQAEESGQGAPQAIVQRVPKASTRTPPAPTCAYLLSCRRLRSTRSPRHATWKVQRSGAAHVWNLEDDAGGMRTNKSQRGAGDFWMILGWSIQRCDET